MTERAKNIEAKEVKILRANIEKELREKLPNQLIPEVKCKLETKLEGNLCWYHIEKNDKTMKIKINELEGKMKKKLILTENEVKRRLEADYDIRLQMAIEEKEKEYIIKYKKQIDYEKREIERKLNQKYKMNKENEWNKIINEKAEIARQKSAHSIRVTNFLKQKQSSILNEDKSKGSNSSVQCHSKDKEKSLSWLKSELLKNKDSCK